MSAAAKLGTAVVMGASSGIGKVYAERLAKRGYDLSLIARRRNWYGRARKRTYAAAWG